MEKVGTSIEKKVVTSTMESTPAQETRIIESNTTAEFNPKRNGSFPSFCREYINGLVQTLYSLPTTGIESLVREMLLARDFKRNIFVMGNGGSAANASHFAADLSKDRYGNPEYLFRVHSLVDNSALITMEGNDSGYENIFVNQLRRLMDPADIVIAISSSGNSQNVISAIEYANGNGGRTHALVGFGGGLLGQLANNIIDIPTNKGEYGFHEDTCSVIIHMIIDYLVAHDTKHNSSF